MLFKVKKDPARANCHPAAAAIRSRFKMTLLILATLAVTTTSLIPLITIVYPPIFKLLIPLMEILNPFQERGFRPGLIPTQPPPHDGIESFLFDFLADFSTPDK
jgi:hypothetical protein